VNIIQYGGMSWLYKLDDGFAFIAIREPEYLADQLASIAGII